MKRLSSLIAMAWLATSVPVMAIVTTPYPIVFVTQVPVPADFTTIASVFGNQLGDLQSAARGGDLWIRYGDGSLRNLTQAAGVSSTGLLGANAIAVRDPAVYWDASKVIFSAVVGAPTKQYQVADYYWQLYEITGLGPNDQPVITKVPNQPANYNNISPIYGSDDQIIFTSDRPRNGERHLYPQRDEYEEAPTVTGLWRLNPKSGELALLNHTPSGAFTPTLDSAGRVIFTRWDHLQRDQQADSDRLENGGYGTFNYSDESATALRLNDRSEVFPEPRQDTATVSGNHFNQFFPWQIREDGTGEETLNHVGRHELAGYGAQSFLDDPNLTYCCNVDGRYNRHRLMNDSLLQIKEDPTTPGRYFGTSAPEFGTHAAGQLVWLNGAPSDNPDHMTVTYLTASATASATEEGKIPSPDHTGLYREPLPLSDGHLVAVHTPETRGDRNVGTSAAPLSRYDLRLKQIVVDANGVWRAGEPLTAGIRKKISYYDPDTLVSYDANLWELNPVELRPRVRPVRLANVLPVPETQVFAQEGVEVAQFQDYLKQNDLAVVVTRNVTLRDQADVQQPFNLRVRGGATAISKPGKVYDISHWQFYQADQLRGIGGTATPRPGRRVLAQLMHEPKAANMLSGVPSAVAIAPDGSAAALVPARRALSWQLTNNATPVVRERYWLTFQPGEIRVCASCHGINQAAHGGQPEPQNQPEGLRQLLRLWKAGMTVKPEDRVFNWAERTYGDHFLPKNPTTLTAGGYTFRYYSSTNEYLGAKDGRAFYYDPKSSGTVMDVGALQQYINSATSAGF